MVAGWSRPVRAWCRCLVKPWPVRLRARWICFVLTGAVSLAASRTNADFSHTFFELPTDVSLRGSAGFWEGLQLTSYASSAGGLWFTQPQGVGDGFVATFRIVGQPYDGEAGYSPGFAFVLHDDPQGIQALGEPGQGLGFASLSRSLAIVFDTAPDANSEFPGQHVAIRTRGPDTNNTAVDSLIADADLDALGFDLLDGHDHTIAIQYTAPLGDTPGELAVFIHGMVVLATPIDLRAIARPIPDGGGGIDFHDITSSGFAFVGLTSGSTSLSPPITLLDWAFVDDTAGCVPPRWYGLDWLDGAAGGKARMSVQAVGTFPLTFRWFRGTEVVQTDPEGRIQGVGTSTLHINNLGPADGGRYTCLIMSACGVVTTGEVAIFPCRSDTNRDGAVDPDDLADYIAAFFSGDPLADLDLDGELSPDDLADYIGLYFGGC